MEASDPVPQPPQPPQPSRPRQPPHPPQGLPGPRALEPVHVDVQRVVLVGTAAWLVALVVVLAVPGLHSGSRDWWPWAAVAGALLGLAGLAYLRRGRGNATAQ